MVETSPELAEVVARVRGMPDEAQHEPGSRLDESDVSHPCVVRRAPAHSSMFVLRVW
jgi:hypothetical protein